MLSAMRVVILLVLVGAGGLADAMSFTGSLNPNDANDLLQLTLTLATPTSVLIQTYGYGGSSNAPGGTNAAGTVIVAGGFDTYLSLFLGIGPSATFLMSNDDGTCPLGAAIPACHDSTLDIASLGAGSYTLVLSVFDNFSFAENLGMGTLGDGFIGLGDYYDFASGQVRTANYAVDIITGGAAAPVAEPGSFLLFVTALVAGYFYRNKVVSARRSPK
jgi:hypothetical protein